MRTAAVIAEFNPFHNGHKYLCDMIKSEYNVDYCIAIMSGDFVQRGDVAIVDKHVRAKAAANAGFSAVFELPAAYATASAPDFAYGGAAIADALGVDFLFFGSESGDMEKLTQISCILSSDDAALNASVNTYVKSGMSYAKAVSESLKSLGITDRSFDAPNDILAVEYIKALNKLGSKVTPVAIKRKGVDHDSTEASEDIASATYIRSLISQNKDYSNYLPDDTIANPLDITDFYSMLSYRLHFITPEELSGIYGVSYDLSRKIKNCCDALTYRELVDSIKSKNFSESTIRRALIHILLDIKKDDICAAGHITAPKSVRLLAMNKNDTSIIKYFKEKDGIRIITKPAEIQASGDKMLLFDLQCSDLYHKVYSSKYSLPFTQDCRISPDII